MGFFKKVLKAMSSQKYRTNPYPTHLTDSQLLALNIGAINAEQTSYYCDSLETGCDKQETADNLANYYDICDSRTASTTLNWLKDEGHRVYFDAIKKMVAGASSAMDTNVLAEEQIAIAYTYVEHLKSTVEELMDEKCIADIKELGDASIIAWDMGKLVLVSRCCCELGYISEAEAWEYINYACTKCKETYEDWSSLANGYIIGRAMWNGSNMMLTGIIGIAQDLLRDSNSPWKKISLHQSTTH